MQNLEWLKIKEVFVETVSLPRDERDSFLANHAPFIQSEVRELIKSHEEADDFIIEAAAVELGFSEDVNIGQQIDDYKIVALIGEGGMGNVYLAERVGFEQKVALKLIKRGMDSRAVLKRFKLERQILSRLNHPNIAKLLDGGETPDGLPYFVMEYIEGQPITKFCDEHQIDVNARLELFQKVCNAITYAHQNLIIHRDLKPSNIIVTADGTPKLLDFGIAKLLDDEIEHTATVGRMFTPEYASPEQISGIPITTATDVYSLGVVLYELLSGVRPFNSKSKNYAEIVNLVLTAEPVRPSYAWQDAETPRRIDTEKNKSITASPRPRNAASISSDIDNIILKALRKESESRYQAVGDFSADIRRHLQGFPVTATADSFRYRFSKFFKRNTRTVVAGSIISLLVFVISGIAVWQAVVANNERAKAEHRFNDVRKLANSVIFEYQDAISNLSGATEISEKMLNDAVVYLDRLSLESVDDIELQLELAKAYVKVGDIQGNTFNANRSRFDLAEESYQKARALNERVLEKKPTDSNILKQLAENYSKIAALKRIQGNLEESVKYYQKTADFFRRLLDENPNDNAALTAFASTQINIATQREEPNQVEESLRICREAVEIYEKLLATDPSNKSLKSRRLGGYDALADVLMAVPEKRNEALNLYHKIIELLEEELRAKPDDINIRERIALTHSYVADALNLTGKETEAYAEYKKSLALYEAVVKADEKNDFAGFYRDFVRVFFAKFLAERGNFSEAEEILREPLKNLPLRLAKDPQEFTTDFVVALANHTFGKVQVHLNGKIADKKSDRLKSAEESLQKSILIYEKYFGKVIIPRMSAKDLAEDARQYLEITKNS